MSESETADIAAPLHGDKLYQQRARVALPLLVRQAKAGQTIYYANLAEELGMPNPRNLNYVLGSVGQTLINLGTTWGEAIPPIQCLVVNQADGLPGEGVAPFLANASYRELPKRQRRHLVNAHLQGVFSYPRWNGVLAALSLPPAASDFRSLVNKATLSGRGGGESEDHKRLKEHVAANPGVVGLPRSVANGVNEYRLPSGDELDVLFRHGDEWIAVEVKSSISGDNDLVRGFFQCVKYQAVLEALLRSTNRKDDVRTVLVVTRPLPPQLLALKNLLGIEVIELEEPVVIIQTK